MDVSNPPNVQARGGALYNISAQSHWAKLKDKQSISEAAKLHYEEPIVKDGKKVAQLDLNEVAAQAQSWNSVVICMVMGANPPFAVFEGFVKCVWGHLGIERIVRMHIGLTIVKFNDEATRDFILETGMVQFDKKPMIVRPWTQDLDTIRLVRSVPLWIRLPNLGLQYWGQKCLSALVSTIGKPIMVDKFTKERSMIRYARILVEMEISDNSPFIIYFVNERGQVQEQFFEYEWLPIKCNNCKGYDHNMAECKKTGSNNWVKKEVAALGKDGVPTVPGVIAAEITTGSSAKDPDPAKEDLGKNEVASIDHSKDTVGATQVMTLSPNSNNKEIWEVPKKTGNSRGKGKMYRPGIDKKQNAFKVLQE
ncbi:uncharacterized protein LOC133779166 [Humulus lupulus]|uniref:uncharacterized protein LOC133779166 n=1 Tax=Humulus lupulus TaxID=3486 RepID=UPI002B40E010|nr:uncharacterized protein LOC133779166 [Humulus lupulus]